MCDISCGYDNDMQCKDHCWIILERVISLQWQLMMSIADIHIHHIYIVHPYVHNTCFCKRQSNKYLKKNGSKIYLNLKIMKVKIKRKLI